MQLLQFNWKPSLYNLFNAWKISGMRYNLLSIWLHVGGTTRFPFQMFCFKRISNEMGKSIIHSMFEKVTTTLVNCNSYFGTLCHLNRFSLPSYTAPNSIKQMLNTLSILPIKRTLFNLNTIAKAHSFDVERKNE